MTDPTGAEGHRSRLRDRLFEGGGEALLDHELVEYLLGLSIRRMDTKPIAKRLLAEFGGLGGLMAADPETLMKKGRLNETSTAAILIAKATAVRLLRTEVAKRPVLGSWSALLDYLRADMGHHAVERVRVLHLNARNELVRDELVGEGTIDQAPIFVREVVARALDLGSASLILVHNHPSGDPQPSRQDVQVTKAIIDAGRPLGVTVHDHVIVGANGHASLRALGLI